MAGLTHTNGFKKDVFILKPSNSKSFEYNTSGGLMILRTGFNASVGLYILNLGSGYSAIKETPGVGSYFTIVADKGTLTITNTYTGSVEISIMIVNLD